MRGGQAVPVNFFAKGRLNLEERQLTFESRDPRVDNEQCAHLTPDFRQELPYAHLTQVEHYEAAEPPSKYFNLSWVRLHMSRPDAPNDLLLFSSGSGTQVARITQTNELLYE